MKKKLAIILSLVLALALLAGCGKTANSAAESKPGEEASSEQAETYTLKTHLSTAETDPCSEAARQFKAMVEEKTDGHVIVELYYSSSLGETADCLEGLSIRACDIAFVPIANLSPVTDLSAVDPIPYLYSGIEHYRAVWEGEIGEQILADLEADCGMKIMAGGLLGVRVTTSNVPIYGPEDVKGLKIRVPTTPIYVDTWEWLGATPTPLSAGEIFTSLQQNTVQAQENPYTTCASMSLQECCKYVTETNHAYSTNAYIMDQNFFDSLPAEYQAAIEEAAAKASLICTDLVIEQNEEKKQVFVDAGCEIIETDITEWQEALDGFIETKYPYLLDYYNMILEADPAK